MKIRYRYWACQLLARSLQSLEPRLDPKHFFRAIRKHIVKAAAAGKFVRLDGIHR